MNAQPTPPNPAAPDESAAAFDGSSASHDWRARVLAPLALFFAALAIRALPWPSVLTPERVLFVGTDAYYHARRIVFGLVNFPSTLEFDRYINFPDGAPPIWSPLFDFFVTLLLRPFLDGSDSVALDRALVWVPPLLGASAVVALYALTRRHFDTTTALVAGVLLCVLSGHFWYSQIGFLDHHAAVALFSVVLMAACMQLVALLERSEGRRIATAGAIVAVGAISAGCLLLWPGMLLHVALAQLGIAWVLVALPDRLAAARAAESFAAANAIALGLVLLFADAPPASSVVGPYSPVVLSRFQPWLFAVLAIQMTVLGVLWRGGSGESAAGRALQIVAVGALLLITSAALLPDLLEAASDGWRWLGKREHFQSTVAESRGLFAGRDGFSVRIAEARLSRFLYLFPVALATFAWHYRRRAGARAALLVVPWALGLAIVTVAQKRFFNSFSIPLALLFGWSLVHATRWVAARTPSPQVARWVPAAAVVALALLLAPLRAAYEAPLSDQWKLLRGEAPERRLAGPDLRTLISAADWMRSNTDETSGFFDGAEPEYGVMALWGNGHVIEYKARRPTVTDSFGDDIGEANFRASLRYFASESESQGSAILDELGVRYVLAESLTGGRRAPRDRKLMTRLFHDDGNGLSRHRLLFEAIAEAGRAGLGPDHVKVFEHVKGARVRGRAPAGARVRAQLGFTTNRGRRGTFSISATASEAGVYELTLPYSTHGGPPALLTEAAYRLHIDGGTSESLRVDERDVRQGGEVAGPTLATLPQPAARATSP